MCQFRHYICKDKSCKHQWLEITHPCTPSSGFSTCPTFLNAPYLTSSSSNTANQLGKPTSAQRRQRHAKIYIGKQLTEANKEDCPWHGLRGDYDVNRVRVVTKRKWWKMGFSPLTERTEGTARIMVCSVM